MRELIFLALVLAGIHQTLKRPVVGVAIYLGINILRPEMFFWGGYQGSYAFKVIYGALLLSALCSRPYLRWDQLGCSQMYLTLWILVAVYFSIFFSLISIPEHTYTFVGELVKLCGILALMFLLVQNESDIYKIQSALLGCFAFLAIWGVQQSFLGNERLEGLGGNAWSDSNGIAAMYVMFLPIPFAIVFQKKGLPRWIAFIVGFLLLALIICTKSRAGFLGIIFSLFAFGYFAHLMKKVFILAIVLLFLALPLISDTYTDRLKTMKSSESLDGSASSRIILWQAGLMVFAENPIFGSGFLTYPEAKMKFEFRFDELDPEFRAWVFRHERKKVTHNAYIQVLSDCGLMGFIPFCLLCFGGISTGLYARRELSAISTDIERNLNCYLLAGMSAGFFGFSVAIFTIDAFISPFIYWQLGMISLMKKYLIRMDSTNSVSV